MGRAGQGRAGEVRCSKGQQEAGSAGIEASAVGVHGQEARTRQPTLPSHVCDKEPEHHRPPASVNVSVRVSTPAVECGTVALQALRALALVTPRRPKHPHCTPPLAPAYFCAAHTVTGTCTSSLPSPFPCPPLSATTESTPGLQPFAAQSTLHTHNRLHTKQVGTGAKGTHVASVSGLAGAAASGGGAHV